MNFSNPNAFWLLFLIIVPILIHLFQFRRYKTLQFSNLYFLSAVNEEEKRSRKLKHLLILASRILLILFLVLSMVKPYWESDAMQAEVNMIILDKTPSNLSFAEGKSNSILEENMSFINQLYEKYPQELEVLDQSGQSVEAYAEGQIQENKSTLSLDKIIGNNKGVEKVLLLGDFQKQIIDQNLDQFKDSTNAYVLMPPYLKTPNNVMVDSVWVSQVSSVGENADLKIRLQSIGNNLEVNVSLNNNDQLIGTQQIELGENSTAIVDFPVKRFSDKNSKSFNLSLEGDQIGFDNEFYFTILNQEKVKVLSLSSDQENEFINALFANDELFEFQSELLNNFSFQDLDEFDLVVLQIGDKLNNFASSALKTYASTGNNLVIIPETNFDQYDFIEDLGFNDASPINQSNQKPVTLAAPDIQNPFFKNVFSSMDDKLTMPEAKLFMRWSGGQSILSFANTYPFLSLSGPQTNVYAFSVPLIDDYTSFIRHGIFLPIWYKIAFSNLKENQVQYFYLNEDVIEVSVPELATADIFKLRQSDQELVPDQRISGNQLKLILPQEDMKSGFYDIINTKTEDQVAKLALNFPKSESETQYYTRSEIKDLFQSQANVEVLDGYDFSSVSDYIEETKKGFPLWKYFLVLALLSLLAEVLIIRFLK